MKPVRDNRRRQFLKAGVTTAAGLLVPAWSVTRGAPAIIAAESDRPQALQGLQLGDPSDGSLVVWSRSDRPARMLVDWSYDEQFQRVHRIRGPHALETTDFTARQDLAGLKAGRDVFVRVSFQSLTNDRVVSEPVTGHFVVPPGDAKDDDDDDRFPERTRAGVRRTVLALAAPSSKERRLAHGRRALLRRAPLRPDQGRVPRLRSVLGVRRRAAQRGDLRPQCARRHVRPAGGVLEGAAAGQSNLSPYSGLQFFGEVNIAGYSGDMTVDLRDINGVSVFSKRLLPRLY